MALIGSINRSILERATAVYIGGVPITVLNAQGQVIIGSEPPEAPAVISAIADRVYEVGSGPYTINLAEKISGADSYVVTPANANLSLSGNTLTISPTATLNQTTISIIGRNGGGDSAPLTFALTVNAVAPTVTMPLPDRNLAFGAANVSIALDDFFAGVASYAVSPAANGATISGRNLVLSAAQVRSLDITVTGTNSTGQSVSDTFLFAVAQTTQAPSVQTPPTITGSTTVGSILTRTAGTATGIPTPTRATVWLRNGDVIPGQTGNTLDTSGFAADDVITTRDDWTNSQGTASGTSAPWTLTVQPAITATIDLQPAGQQSSITFNVAIDGSPTIAQGSTSITATRVGTTNQWTFVAPVGGPISFAATKAGYTAFSDATRTVAPALSVLVIRDRELMVDNEPTADRTLDISAPDRFDATGINIAADQYTDGMKVIAAPVIERNEDVITASRGGLFSWFAEQEPVFFSHDYYRGATPQTATLIPGTTDVESYTVDPVADGGKNIYRRDRIVNALQASVPVFSNGIAVASAMSNGLTPLGAFDGGVAETSSISQTTAVDIGPADEGKTVWLFLLGHGAGVAQGEAKLKSGGVDYVGTRHAAQTDSTAGYTIELWSFACPIGGMVDLNVVRASSPNRPRGFLSISKGLTQVSTHTNGHTAVAGTEFNYSNGTTLEGDILLTAIAGAGQGLASGMFSNVHPVSELFDGISGNAQLMVAAGPVAAASTARIYMTSSVGGGLRWITLKLRSA